MLKNMMLITSTWGEKNTFKMIPLSTDCQFNEAIYDLDAKVLALISKEKKQSLHMVPKMNEYGDVSMVKTGKRSNGKDFAEERKTLETYYEYYIEKQEEIIELVEKFAANSDNFDYKQYFAEETK